MPYIKRRQFLQFAGSTAFTMAISQLDIIHQSQRYAKALSQSTPRKLALLVGINEYKNDITPLWGCLNDVALQRELLTHRFGFNKEDILTLTNAQATRQGILQAFNEHLIKQAKPGDVVVFHFSGHGSRVQDRDKDMPDGLNSTLVPIDSSLPADGGVVQDIMGHTLFLLMYALKTENVTVVLDSCHSGGAKRGNFIVRSRDYKDSFLPSPAEYEEQRKLLSQTGLSQAEFIDKRRKNVAKGIVITAAKRDQLALDGKFGNVSAGAFTSSLTQYLWLQNRSESFQKTFEIVSQNVSKLAFENRGFQELEVEANVKNPNSPIFFLPIKPIPAEAVVTLVNGNEVDLWLGGVNLQNIEAYGANTILTVVDSQGKKQGQVQIDSRNGLAAKGKLLNTGRALTKLNTGMLLQERVRAVPKNFSLKIGLDDASLDSSTIAQAKQALQAIPRIEAVALRQQEVQYIFGRMTQTKYKELKQKRISDLPAVGSFGLFLPTSDAIIASSFGSSNETVGAAVQRLQPKLKSFLAARVIKQALGNTNTSQINVAVSMIVTDSKKTVAQAFTTRGRKNTGINLTNFSSVIPKLPVGKQITFKVTNFESIPLYLNILGVDNAGGMDIIFPYDRLEGAVSIEAGQEILVPNPEHRETTINIVEPLGFAEVLVIASTAPLTGSVDIIKTLATERGLNKRGLIATVTGDEFLNLTNSLLDDLDRTTRSRNNSETIQLPSGVNGADTKKLAVMTITFEVVK